jgi:hypothetical protein
MIATREPDSKKGISLAEEIGVPVGDFAKTAAFAELAVLCTLWSGTKSAIDLAGPDRLAGKIVVDTTNPLVFAEGKPPALALGHGSSGGEQVQAWLPRSRVVKAWNSVGNAHMYKPSFRERPSMFICGEDETARKTVAAQIESFGWEAIDIGGISGARVLEPLSILWVGYGARAGTWNHAFKLLKE